MRNLQRVYFRNEAKRQGLKAVTKVKFCGFTRRIDIEVAVQLGVYAIGLNFYKESPRFVDIALARQLRQAVPSHIPLVGLFVNPPLEEVVQIASEVGLDVLQLHGDETVEQAAKIAEACRLPYWKVARCRSADELKAAVEQHRCAQAWLLDSFSPAYGGTGERFDWSILAPYSAQERGRMFLAGGLTPDNVAQAIRECRTAGVDVSSGIQVPGQPREKSAVLMESFMARVIGADQ